MSNKIETKNINNLVNELSKGFTTIIPIDELKKHLKIIIKKGDLIYLKGSRTMKLERIYKAGIA